MYSNHQWNEADHPRDDDGKFTFKKGEKTTNTKENPANILYRDSKIKAQKDKQEAEYKSKLLNILGDKAKFAEHTALADSLKQE